MQKFLCVCFLVVILSAIVKAQVVEDFYDLSTSARANDARGCVRCTSNQLEYSISNSDAIALITSVPSSAFLPPYVSRVVIGDITNNDPKCAGKPVPTIRSTSHLALVDYGSCGVTMTQANRTIFYSGTAIVTIRFNTSSPTNYRLAHFSVPVKCEKAEDAPISVVEDFAEVITPFDELAGNFEVTIRATTTYVMKPFFDVTTPMQVVLLNVEIDPAFRDHWTLIIDRLWATAVADISASPSTDYIRSQSCVPAEHSGWVIKTNQSSDFLEQYEVVPVQFEEAANQQLFFHANVNVCPKNGDLALCRQACASTRLGSKSNAENPKKLGFYVQSRKLQFEGGSRVIIGKDGVPRPRSTGSKLGSFASTLLFMLSASLSFLLF